MRPYRLTTPALGDLRSTLDYLRSYSPAAASRFLLALDRRLKLLAQFPGMGVMRDEFGYPNLRFLIHAGHLIAYDPSSKPLTIVAIRHGSRDPRTFLDNLET